MRKASQKDVALALGLSRATVSLALRGHPRISAETRRRVEHQALNMGYQRDPMLSALASYRWSQANNFHGVIAWLANHPEKPVMKGISKGHAALDWRHVPEFYGYYSGALERAGELGYKLVVIYLDEYKLFPGKVAEVLKNRGIHGILGCPMPKPHTCLEFPVDQFASVLFGYSIDGPLFNRVASHHYRSVVEIYERMVARGYRRIGYVISSFSSDRVKGSYKAAYLMKQSELFPGLDLPVMESGNLKELIAWENKYKPDAIITSRSQFHGWPDTIQKKIPYEIGVAVVSTDPASAELAGTNECSYEVGRIGAQFLAFLVELGDGGYSSCPQHWLVEPKWQEGASLPDRNLTIIPSTSNHY